MADNTIIQQGYFTSDGNDKILYLRSDVDWIETINIDALEGSNQWEGIKYYWQRGMNNNDAVVYYHGAASQAIYMSTCETGYNGATYRGISLIDSSDKTPGAAVAVTAGTNATQPVYSTADTGTMQPASIVRIQKTAHTNINGLDFSVSAVTADTNFTLRGALQQAPGVVAGAAGTYRFIAQNRTIYDMFYPKKRVICNITQANPAVVTTLVDHGYATGDRLRIKVPDACGMTELDDQEVTITYVSVNTFSIGVDTSGYTAFAFPLPAAVPFTPAEAIPRGTSATVVPNPLENKGFIGVIIGCDGTSASPGGQNGDVIKWRAGKSFANILG